MKKKIFLFLFCGILLLTLVGCRKTEGENTKNVSVFENDYIKINGIYVDESYEDENLELVYLFYTLNSNDKNLDISSSTLKITINDKNEYSPVLEKDFIPKYTDFYYSNIIKKIYVGNEYKMCSTYKIPKGDLVDSKPISLNNSYNKLYLDDLDKIKFTTNDIKVKSNFEEIAKDLDNSVYETRYNEEQDKLASVDSSTESKVKKDINGYYIEGYVNVGTTLSKYKIEFESPNKFIVSNSYGLSNNGTYIVKKGALILNYSTGKSNVLYYSYDNGDISVNLNEAFGTLVEYDPLGE